MAMVPYVVRSGEYLAQIAFRLGFDADQVWGAPENAALRASRKDPNILAPGDVLYCPDERPAPLAVTLGSANSYEGKVPVVSLRIRLVDGRGKVHAGAACTVEGAGEPQHLGADGDGVLSFEVPLTVRSVRITLDAIGFSFETLVGGLDPKDEASGRRMRLRNLGFLPGGVAEVDDEERLAAALAAFQAVHGAGGGDPWEHVAAVHGC